MRLDIDALRDAILHLEKALSIEISEDIISSVGETDPLELYKELGRKYESKQEAVLYAVRTLSDAGLINKCVSVGADGEWSFGMINDITFAGHEFLEYIRNNDTWAKTKAVAKKAGCQALSFLGQTAGSVVSGLISGQTVGA